MSANASVNASAKDIKKEDSVDNNEEVDTCVVCFKTLEIYSIGECDHPVCYECSTRMRALCQQNECPICRQMLNKVIFTFDKLPYRELESKNRSEFYNRKYKISFSNSEIQQRFFALLDHPCPKCNCLPYRTFQGLRNHVKREHDMLYCDLCVEHLKIFTFERRCYTQSELNIHRTKGDADNKSHRGHPLCEYCNKRYLDRDELFRHLRREHYFCHFCDADGCNEFYGDYEALAEHFRQDHYLCEEGRCATEQFIGAFRTEIDYKAHVASVHGNTLNKQQAKQTRTLQLEITLGPRSNRNNQHDTGIANMRSRRNHSESSDGADAYANSSRHLQQSQQTIDARNEEDFPSLISTNNGTNMSLVAPPPPPLALRRSAVSGLARTKENFPELGSGGGGGAIGVGGGNTQKYRTAGQPIAAMLKKVPNPTTNSAMTTMRPNSSATINANTPGTSGMMIHLSNRPQSSNNSNAIAAAKKSMGAEFPALPLSGGAKGKKAKQQRSLDEDMLPPPSNASAALSGAVSAKHRQLVEDYVSVANPKNFQKIQTVQQGATDGASLNGRKSSTESIKSVPKLSSSEFPSLSGGKSNAAASNQNMNWSKPGSAKKQRELENRKAKVALAPQLPTTPAANKSNGVNKGISAGNSAQQQPKQKAQQQPQKPTANEIDKKDKKSNNKDKTALKENNSQQQQSNKQNGKSTNSNNANNNNNLSNKSNSTQNLQPLEPLRQQNQSLQPPPGFNDGNQTNNNHSNKNQKSESRNANMQLDSTPHLSLSSASSPSASGAAYSTPPGFQTNVVVNSVATSPNKLTFTTSMGESFNIIPKHVYTPLPDSVIRNQNLVGLFKSAMNNNIEAFDEFRMISQLFREGSYKASAFYEHCQSALGNRFDAIFPELLTLLPDISKQQALYLVHTQRVNALPSENRKKLPKLEVCPTCKQVLLKNDAVKHKSAHEFPTLLKGGGAGKRK